MDSRGHGRSSRDETPYSYELMASDVIGLMDYLQLKKASIVGWSDGGILALMLAIHYPTRVNKIFVQAANTDPSMILDISQSDVFNSYLERVEEEYIHFSPTPDDFDDFLDAVVTMWTTQPQITEEQLQSISAHTWIVVGDHDEAINREDTYYMARTIPYAGLLIQPEVSHFSMIQDPEQYTEDVVQLLKMK